MITRNGQKLTPKQWAVDTIMADLELCTDYYYERYQSEWEKMTTAEQDAVTRQINLFHDRFLTILDRAKGRPKK